MNQAGRSWPPLIHVAIPRWMKWRDAALTAGMWVLFGYLLQRQLALMRQTYTDGGHMATFLTRLLPYSQVALLLVALLVLAAWFTERRRRRGFGLPEPAPLTLADQARRAGMEDAALSAARDLRIAVVHIDAEGRYRIGRRAAGENTPGAR